MRNSGTSNRPDPDGHARGDLEGSAGIERSRGFGRSVALHLLALVLVVLVSGFVGAIDWSPLDVWNSWTAPDGTAERDLFEEWWFLRVRRTLLAAATGAALALAGVAFQATLRNPLAEPYLLGVSNGASLGTLIVLIAVGATSAFVQPVAAFVGACLSVAVLFGAAGSGRLRHPSDLILAGVIVNAILGAVILFLWTTATRDQLVAGLFYLMGDVDYAALSPGRIPVAFSAALVGLVGFWRFGRGLDLLALGDADAFDLGLDANRFRWIAIGIASLVTALAVAACGPIGFVGLVVPHTVRRLHGPTHRSLVPLSAIAGATFLVAADVGARLLAGALGGTGRLPIGVVTAIVGGPFFLALLLSKRRAG